MATPMSGDPTMTGDPPIVTTRWSRIPLKSWGVTADRHPRARSAPQRGCRAIREPRYSRFLSYRMHNPIGVPPALAGAGVNVQPAISIASHSDARTPVRYVMKTAAMRTIPEAAVPQLLGAATLVRAQAAEGL
jgi:hypothetical protein